MTVRPWMLGAALGILMVLGGLVVALAIRAEGFSKFDAAVAAYRAAGNPVTIAELAALAPPMDPGIQGQVRTVLATGKPPPAKVSEWFNRPIGDLPAEAAAYLADTSAQRTGWRAVPDAPLLFAAAAALPEAQAKGTDFKPVLQYPSWNVHGLAQALAIAALDGDTRALADLDRLTGPWLGPKRLLDARSRLLVLGVDDQTHLALAWRGMVDPGWDAWLARPSGALDTCLESGEIDTAYAIWLLTEYVKKPGKWREFYSYKMTVGKSSWWQGAWDYRGKILTEGADEADELAALQADRLARAAGSLPARRASTTVIGSVANGFSGLLRNGVQAQVSHRTMRLAAYVLRQADTLGHLPPPDDPAIAAACAADADPQPLIRIPLIYEILSPQRFRIITGPAPAGTWWAASPDLLPVAPPPGKVWSLAPRQGILPCVEWRGPAQPHPLPQDTVGASAP